MKNSTYGIGFESIPESTHKYYDGGKHILKRPILTTTSAIFYEDLLLNKIIYKKQTTANKSHTCEMCGCEIHKNELVWWYKPKPFYFKGLRKYFKWRKRCMDHEPKSYAELEQILAHERTYGAY